MSELKRIPIIVFTGAGASRADPIKLPTMSEFFDAIMDDKRIPTSERITNKEYFTFIMDTIYKQKTDYDLERVMGALYQMTTFIESDNWELFLHPSIFDNIFYAINSRVEIYKNQKNFGSYYTKEAIRSSAISTWNERKKDAPILVLELEDLIREKYEIIPFPNIQAVYAPFFELLVKMNRATNNAPIIPFFTTNYDMSVDWFFYPRDRNDRQEQLKWRAEHNLHFVDGFDNQEWDAQNFNMIDETENTTNILFVPYHKLHGSLYWEDVEGTVRRNFNIAKDVHLRQKLMIVYPSDKGILSRDPYHYSHRVLESYLSRADNLLVVGFSFRDPAIVQTFQDALRYNPGLKIHIILPDKHIGLPEDAVNFIRMNNNRVTHINQRFGTDDCLRAIDSVMLGGSA